MKILVTGNKGFLGKYIEIAFFKMGIEIEGIDIVDGDDLLDIDCVESKIKHCDSVLHLATYNNKNTKLNEINTNISAYINLLKSMVKYRIKEIINISSVDAIGIFKGERNPDYFPIDEEHVCYPSTDYGISKKFCEDISTYFSMVYNLSITSLRPPGIWDQTTYEIIKQKRKENPEYEWKPYWEYGAFIDIRDLISLILQIIKGKSKIGHMVYNVCADNITTSGKASREIAKMIYPDVPWKDYDEYKKMPYKAILKNDKVKQAFKWSPLHNWHI